MRVFIGILLILAGVVAGVYVGLWLMFIGGIVQIVDAVQASPVSGMDIGVGIVRIVFAGFTGTVSAFVLILPGAAIAGDGK